MVCPFFTDALNLPATLDAPSYDAPFFQSTLPNWARYPYTELLQDASPTSSSTTASAFAGTLVGAFVSALVNALAGAFASLRSMLFRSIMRRLEMWFYSCALNDDRAHVFDLPPLDTDWHTLIEQHGIVTFVTTALPMDVARPQHPAVHSFGPFLYAPSGGGSSIARDSTRNTTIDADADTAHVFSIARWLDRAMAEHEPVIYVSMGSIGSFTLEQWRTVMLALCRITGAIDDDAAPEQAQRDSDAPRPRVLWARGFSLFQQYANRADLDPSTSSLFSTCVRGASTTPSSPDSPHDHSSPSLSSRIVLANFTDQKAVLAHGAVRVYMNHCGMSSMHEAILFGVPSLAFPLFLDQLHVAERAVINGVALLVDKDRFTEHELTLAVRTLLARRDYFLANIRELNAMFAYHGGVQRADQLVRMLLDASQAGRANEREQEDDGGNVTESRRHRRRHMGYRFQPGPDEGAGDESEGDGVLGVLGALGVMGKVFGLVLGGVGALLGALLTVMTAISTRAHIVSSFVENAQVLWRRVEWLLGKLGAPVAPPNDPVDPREEKKKRK